MEKFLKIEYIDAKYTNQAVSLVIVILDAHQAYGSLATTSNSDYILDYVVTDNPNFKNKIMEGLILPKGSLVSEYKDKNYQEQFIKSFNDNGIKIKDKVEITWKDVVHVIDSTQVECSIMYTEGIIHRIYNDFILVSNPETIRSYPLPVKNHPPVKPLYYVIPKSFILEIKKI